MIKKTLIASALMATMALTAPAAFAADEYNTSTGMTAAGAQLGLHGVDPVGFINTGSPVEGAAAHTSVHDGVAYYFISADNKSTFEANPTDYLPQNGGFCTFGVSVGKKFDGDPQYHAVIDNKLYVFLNEEIFGAFNDDRKGTINKAEVNWKEIRNTAVEEL